MDAGRESGRRLPHSKTLREFRGGDSEYAPALGVRLSSAAFLPTLLYRLNSWLFSRLQPHRGFSAEASDRQFAQIGLSVENDIQNHVRHRLRGCLHERDGDR